MWVTDAQCWRRGSGFNVVRVFANLRREIATSVSSA